MIWVSLFFTASVVIRIMTQHCSFREWVITAGLLVFALASSAVVSWDDWSQIDLLLWVRWLFEPPTKWLYSIL
ncbi:hypothetical protein LLE49_20320 [Alicyclobacillus tolerans]|uniref:hypothetical protein n=1 Tax=Alicyclobacillus tolerans TaxID=90970 RepID=UPI001F3DB769|nr:hypothetical protein [Alicyclobacillus tolerans]MCF8567071.1 hypothetical protein [Alicyclobacillus tolerans]